MTPILAHRLHDDAVRGFLAVALDLTTPSVDELVAAGIPHYRAREFTAILQRSGELHTTGWNDLAHTAYRELLAKAIAPSSPGRLHRLPEHERPRGKARERGPAALSDGELLAVLLRTGGREGVLELAERLLHDHDGLVGLAECDIAALMRNANLGEAKATEIAAAFEIARRLALARRRARPPLRTPEAVCELLREDLVSLDHERFFCLPLDARSRLIGEPRRVSQGDVDGTDAGPRAFFRIALRAGAVSAIAVHNHPTGDAGPSKSDVAVTRRLIAAGRAVDIAVVDHLILGDGGRHTSLRRDRPELWAG